MTMRPIDQDTSVFVVWELDDIDSFFFEDTDNPQPLYCALLCVDCEDGKPDLIRGYSQRDGIFERPSNVVASLGGIELTDTSDDPYAREIEDELYAEFDARRESAIHRGEN